MPANTGTHSVTDLLQITSGNAFDFGLESILEAITVELNAHNLVVNSALTELSTPTTERDEPWGGATDGEFQEVDEFGVAPSQKAIAPESVAYPLKKYQFNISWTLDYFKTTTPAGVAQMTVNAQARHLRNLRSQIRKALLLSTNYSLRDNLIDNKTLAVKRLINADGQAIPTGPNGETFDGSTHTHYLGYSTLTTTALDGMLSTLVEHGHGADIRIYINKAQEATVRGLSGFTAYLDARIIPSTASNQARGSLDVTRNDNRAIGLYGGAEIWVKDWIPASYLFGFSAGDQRKPLKFRQRAQASLQGLRLAGQASSHPLFAQFFEAEFGFGAYWRTNGVATYIGGASYVDPSV